MPLEGQIRLNPIIVTKLPQMPLEGWNWIKPINIAKLQQLPWSPEFNNYNKGTTNASWRPKLEKIQLMFTHTLTRPRYYPKVDKNAHVKIYNN